MTQTNTTQNKEELIEREFKKRIVGVLSDIKNSFLPTDAGYIIIKNIFKEELDKSLSQAHQSGIEEERRRTEKMRETAGIFWICPQCATQFFNRGFTVNTNIYTQTNMDCDCCKEERPCMHINSYDKSLKENKQ